jgi:hypothetical protein
MGDNSNVFSLGHLQNKLPKDFRNIFKINEYGYYMVLKNDIKDLPEYVINNDKEIF